ncbi:S-adenosyl-L-methionine-dependent methyltransferase [Crepidotus variabilis]|uniref:S-adenosyl-L-methionine-dependent methyltransferase n=1 Tax=Crepidotus variabilis TaxID=179855 RepID=A0A9P6JNY0_9AGAR|nr:S-adenosyl-L-methionine-dependent methyltransferase [Crepidotus variabilis]
MAESTIPQTRRASELESDPGDESCAKRPKVDGDASGVEYATGGTEGVVERIDEDLAPLVKESTVNDMQSNSLGSEKNQPPKRATKKKRKQKEPPLPESCSAPDVLHQEICHLLGREAVESITASGGAFKSPYPDGHELEITIEKVGSGGSGIARAPGSESWAIVVPFALPEEKVRVEIVGRPERMYSNAKMLEILQPNEAWRDDSRVRCQYFTQCGGCQYQMLSSEKQLDLKKNVITRAYETYSKLPAASLPSTEETTESPLVYKYRTKITPHFERPRKSIKPYDIKDGEHPPWLKIGFNLVGRNETMDIEECPIATDVLNEQYKKDRKDIAQKIFSYKKGVSLMYRDSLDGSLDAVEMMSLSTTDRELSEAFTKHVCVTDQKGLSREMVGDYLFEYTAGSFFQNNNTILPLLVDYVKDTIAGPSTSSGTKHPTHLVDTYCGAGLFAISLSDRFEHVAGIELSSASIASAKRNAELNQIPPTKISFLAGDAANIFDVVRSFPPSQTVVVIDPPRKGCDEAFIKQLVEFRAATVVYVSCNVHTQARDVGDIVRRTEGDDEGRRYRVERVRGFDLFPQTAHVESVAVLRLF